MVGRLGSRFIGSLVDEKRAVGVWIHCLDYVTAKTLRQILNATQSATASHHRLPDWRQNEDVVALSTPVSTEHFTRPMAGSIYGIEPTPERFACKWLRPRSPIPGLFFAGSEVTTVGVIGAMMGGVLAAMSVDPVGAMRLMRASGRAASTAATADASERGPQAASGVPPPDRELATEKLTKERWGFAR